MTTGAAAAASLETWPEMTSNQVVDEVWQAEPLAWLESERRRYETTPGLLENSWVARVRYRDVRWELDALRRNEDAVLPDYLLPPSPGHDDYPASYDPQAASVVAVPALAAVLPALLGGAALAQAIGHL